MTHKKNVTTHRLGNIDSMYMLVLCNCLVKWNRSLGSVYRCVILKFTVALSQSTVCIPGHHISLFVFQLCLHVSRCRKMPVLTRTYAHTTERRNHAQTDRGNVDTTRRWLVGESRVRDELCGDQRQPRIWFAVRQLETALFNKGEFPSLSLSLSLSLYLSRCLITTYKNTVHTHTLIYDITTRSWLCSIHVCAFA